MPVAEGGGGATLRQLFEVLMALAGADSNVAHILRVHFSYVERLLDEPDPARRARWTVVVVEGKIFWQRDQRAERQGGRDGLRDDPLPGPAGEGFRLNGEKFYSTGSLYSDYTQIYASTPEERIASITIPVDREGVSILDDWDGFGQRLTGTGTTRLDDVRVEPDEVVDLRGHKELMDAPAIQGEVLQVVGQIAADAFAAQAGANLDRHWRNIRTISTHDPTFLKASAVGFF